MRNASNEQSKESIDQMVNKGDAMRCPKCQVSKDRYLLRKI